jgi:hypothetical protein
MNYVPECDRLIEAMVGKDLVDKWWSSPNKAFDGSTPAEVFSEDPRSVYEYLMWHAYGAGPKVIYDAQSIIRVRLEVLMWHDPMVNRWNE